MKKRWIVIAAGILTLLVMGGVFVIRNRDPYGLQAKPRREWKNRAVAEITYRSGDSAWVVSNIAALEAKAPSAALKAKAPRQQNDSDAWLSPQIILMTNGEWMVFTNICRKEDDRIHDFFIGRASDGKWYYSTFHFCIGMIVLKMQSETEGQPGSVAQFAKNYYLRGFDGQSDECLQKTWPPKHR